MYSTHSTALVIISCVLVPLSTIFVALRFKVRKSTKAGLGLDDYTILATLIFQYAGAAKTIYGAVAGGEGDSLEHLSEDPSELAIYGKLQFIGLLMFATTIALVKTSTLLLYKRIFVTKRFHVACYGMMALTAGWFLASVLGQIFSTKIFAVGWSPTGPFIINYSAFLLSMAAINIGLDAVVVCMPLSVIRTLQMSRARKAQVSGVFLLGLFCVIAAAFRVYYLRAAMYTLSPPYTESQFDKISTASFLVTTWFLIEAQTSIIAACLPTLAPLFHSNKHVAFQHRALPSISSLKHMRPKIMEMSTKTNRTLIESGNDSDVRLSEHLRSNSSHDESITCASNADLRETDIV